jgi:hypothetical protein
MRHPPILVDAFTKSIASNLPANIPHNTKQYNDNTKVELPKTYLTLHTYVMNNEGLAIQSSNAITSLLLILKLNHLHLSLKTTS